MFGKKESLAQRVDNLEHKINNTRPGVIYWSGNKTIPEQIAELQNSLGKLTSMVYDHEIGTVDVKYEYNGTYKEIRTTGFREQLKCLQEENKKLKGIVAELVDYVYGDKK